MPPLPPARIKEAAADFVVEELPAYLPSGSGEHVFIRFTKQDITTMDAVRALSRALGCDPRTAGFAGMKDKRAVTTQTFSVQPPRGTSAAEIVARARVIAVEGITVLDATPHPHKMKAGHLAGNRFAVVLRGIPQERTSEVADAFERISMAGVPNAFGDQRFGSRGDNADRALGWLRGEEPRPRDPRVSRLLWSSLQSAVFNAVLAARVNDGTWTTPLEGDLLKLRTSGGLFGCTDAATDGLRAVAGDVSPTGPIIGARMRWPTGAPAELERRVSNGILGEDFDLARTRSLGEGSRRALRLWVEGLRWETSEAQAQTDGQSGQAGQRELDHRHDGRREHEGGRPTPTAACMRVYFVLPKGSYATTVLAAAVDLDEVRPPRGFTPTDDEEREMEQDGAKAT